MPSDEGAASAVARLEGAFVSRAAGFRRSPVGLGNVLPTVDKVADGEAVYRGFYSAADEAEHGVLCVQLAVSLKVKPSQARLKTSVK